EPTGASRPIYGHDAHLPWRIATRHRSLGGRKSVDTNLILLIIAAVLSLPGGLFMAAIMAQPRGRLLALLGGGIGAAAVAAAIYAYVQTAKPSIDGLSYAIGAFFACSMGVFAGALAVNFLLGLVRRRPDFASPEY